MLRIVHTGCAPSKALRHRNPRSRSSAVSRSPRRRSATCAGAHPSRWQLGRGTLAAHDFAPACPQPTPGDSNEFYDREWGTDPAIALDEDTRVSGSPAAGDGVDSRRRLPDRMHRREGIRRLCPGAPWRGGGFRRLPAQWFGFLAHNRLREEAEARHDDEPYANFGFLDQRAGIRWVVKNIAAFGGDPENITIFGQSAGAGSVLAQICSPLNRGLFQRAIMQSGAGLGMFNRHQQSLEDGHRTAERLFEALGVSSLDEARQVPAAELLAAAEALPVPPESGREGDWSMMVNWVPCVDGRFITDQYARTIARGEQNEVEILLGNTTGEFMETDADGTLLPAGEVGNLKLIAEWIRSGRKVPYYYRFDVAMPGDDAGAFHSSELWFSFGTLATCWRRSSDDTTTCHAGWSPTGRTSPPPETRTVPTRTARRCRNGHGTPRSAATPCGWVSGPV